MPVVDHTKRIQAEEVADAWNIDHAKLSDQALFDRLEDMGYGWNGKRWANLVDPPPSQPPKTGKRGPRKKQ